MSEVWRFFNGKTLEWKIRLRRMENMTAPGIRWPFLVDSSIKPTYVVLFLQWTENLRSRSSSSNEQKWGLNPRTMMDLHHTPSIYIIETWHLLLNYPYVMISTSTIRLRSHRLKIKRRYRDQCVTTWCWCNNNKHSMMKSMRDG